MSDTDGKKPLGLGGSRSGQVKQSFSHGRTKNVVVETKRKRVVVTKPGVPGTGAAGTSQHLGDPSKRPAGISDAEMERRLSALRNAKAREAGEALQRAADGVAREEERQRKRDEIEAKDREERERAAAAREKLAEEERAKALADVRASRTEEVKKPSAKAQPAEEATSRAVTPANAPGSAKPGLSPRKTDREREDRERDARAKAKGDGDRRAGKLTLNDALAGEGGRQRSLAAMKRKQEKARAKALGLGQKAESRCAMCNCPKRSWFRNWRTAWPNGRRTS